MLFAQTRKCPVEAWGIGEQVLCLQSHPEFNISFVVELMINKLYDQGRMDDVQKKECIAKTKNTSMPLSRHTMNKFIFNFLHQ